jgi:hypothetical protein
MRKLKEKRKIKKGKYEDFILEIPGCVFLSIDYVDDHAEIEVFQRDEKAMIALEEFERQNSHLKITHGKEREEVSISPPDWFNPFSDWKEEVRGYYRRSKIETSDEKIINGVWNTFNRRF